MYIELSTIRYVHFKYLDVVSTIPFKIPNFERLYLHTQRIYFIYTLKLHVCMLLNRRLKRKINE